MQRRAALITACFGSVAGFDIAAQTLSATWPKKPVRIMVVYPAGGISDQICRAMADRLSASLGVPVLVDNRAGAGGGVGMALLAEAEPDGHTLAFSAISPLTLLPLLSPLSYDPVRDITPIIGVMHTPTLLVGTPSFDGDSFKDIAALSHSRPGGLRWATSGFGTTGHMVLEQVRLATGAKIVHIPYKGGGQQLNDALGGQFELLSTNVGPAQLQYIANQKLKPLAVGAPTRLKSLPQVLSFAELDCPRANLTSLFGVFAPARTPRAILQRLNAELNKVLTTLDFRSQLLSIDNLPAGGTAEEFVAWITKDRQANAKTVRMMRIKDR